MRLQITHETEFLYATPASHAIETLRLTPRGHDGQYVVGWRIEINRDCHLDAATDAFGNTLHSFTVDGPLDRLTITAIGEIETEDRSGLLSGQVERFPVSLYLRETQLTQPVPAIRALAEAAAAEHGSGIPLLHGLMGSIRDVMSFDVDQTEVTTTAGEALELRHGVCQDFAHIFISAARHLGIPARYVSGYLYRADQVAAGQEAGHGWAEAYVPGAGWIGFDPTNRISPTDAYVRVAVALDYLGAAPIRGMRYGGSGEKMAVRIAVRDAEHDRQ